MKMNKKTRNVLVALAVAGTLASPQGMDYLVNGSYRTHQVGENFSTRVIHEYGDKIQVGNWSWPWGTVVSDDDKDGRLDRVRYTSLSRIPFAMEIDQDSEWFQNAQERYEILMKEYN